MSAKDEDILRVTDYSFAHLVLRSPEPVIVGFWTFGCVNCVTMEAMVHSLLLNHPGKALMVRANVEETQSWAIAYGVEEVPTFLFFHSGDLIDRISGVVPYTWLEGHFDDFLKRTLPT